MCFYPYPNPALYTCWQHVAKKKNYRVTGIWGTGAAQHYQVISYELTPLTGGNYLVVPLEKMIQIVKDEILKPI